MFSFFPREEDFFVLFRKQAALVREGCDLLLEMVDTFDRLDERARQLKDVERRADVVTHEIFERLNRTFITPMVPLDPTDTQGRRSDERMRRAGGLQPLSVALDGDEQLAHAIDGVGALLGGRAVAGAA